MRKLKYILYRIKWHLAPFFNWNPIHLDLELNTNCNQKCVSCWHYEGIPTKQMPIEEAERHLREARKRGFMSVKFTLRGEPLLCKYLPHIVNYAHRLGFVDIMINTNGVLLTKEMLKKLSNLTTCIISVDSLTSKTYRQIHNCGIEDFIKLKENLSEVIKTKTKTNFKVNFHINKYNKAECERLMSVSNTFVLEPVFRYTEKREGQNISVKQERKRKNYCPHAKRRITIHADGQMYPCCVSYNEPGDIQLATNNWKKAMSYRKRIIDFHRNGYWPRTCQKCSSGDVYK